MCQRNAFSFAISAFLGATVVLGGCATKARTTMVDLQARSAAAETAPDFGAFVDQFVEFDQKAVAMKFGATRANGYDYTLSGYRGPGKNPGEAVLLALGMWCDHVGGQIDANAPLQQIGQLRDFPRASASVCALRSAQGNQRVAIVTFSREGAWCDHPTGSYRCHSTVLYVDAADFPRFSAAREAELAQIEKDRLAREVAAQVQAEEAARRERQFDEWRRRVKVGDSCWTGPARLTRDVGGRLGRSAFGAEFWLHALVIDVKRPNVRVKYDGFTSARFRADFGGAPREEWFRVEQLEPEDAHQVGCTQCGIKDLSSLH